MANKYFTKPCNGITPKGRRAKSRHRWSGSTICKYCGRQKTDVCRRKIEDENPRQSKIVFDVELSK